MFIVAVGIPWPPPLNDSPAQSGMKLCNAQPFFKMVHMQTKRTAQLFVVVSHDECVL